jgi:hypothetical protein
MNALIVFIAGICLLAIGGGDESPSTTRRQTKTIMLSHAAYVIFAAMAMESVPDAREKKSTWGRNADAGLALEELGGEEHRHNQDVELFRSRVKH